MTTKSRDSFPDILRGFALLGIALVNIPYLSLDTINAAEGADLTQPTNAAAAFIVMALFQAKFYLLFSFLFGYSAHYVLKDDKSNRRRWVARSIGLVILGVIHFTFLFHGDILFLYGLFGLILTALYFRSEKVIRGWTKGIYIAISVLFAALSVLTYVGEMALSAQGKSLPDETFTSRLDGALETGTFLETVGPRLELWLLAAPNGFLLQGPLVFAAFLVGVLVARKNGLVTPNPALMKKLLVWGLAIGLPLQFLAAYIFIGNSTGPDSLGLYLVSLSLNFLTAPLLSAAYVVLLWKVSKKLKLGLMASAGRMSLTVYLSQSVVFSTLFSAWGFGLFAKLGVLEVTLIAAFTWLALAAASVAYLKFKDKGPMESLLSGFSKLFERKR
ncbi:MAG: DUF418 domain-containing protein [Actinobacteria bacterium]|uniref:Unannotated protein n=1 Tax=freshwater metagenome TaxID=449393 RepID=A0A6J6C2N1_9ZZZZ|nr:DUF418 domain-containing protein [Actinomycetota bacterium]